MELREHFRLDQRTFLRSTSGLASPELVIWRAPRALHRKFIAHIFKYWWTTAKNDQYHQIRSRSRERAYSTERQLRESEPKDSSSKMEASISSRTNALAHEWASQDLCKLFWSGRYEWSYRH